MSTTHLTNLTHLTVLEDVEAVVRVREVVLQGLRLSSDQVTTLFTHIAEVQQLRLLSIEP